jgi:protein-tyrosine kinase
MAQTKLFFAPAVSPRSTDSEHTIGAILVESGRLTSGDAQRILALQREEGLRFGEAGTRLRLLRKADVEFALSRQFGHPYLVRGESPVNESVIAAYGPTDAHIETLRALRSQIMLRWSDTEADRKKMLAICSADRNEGRSFIAANLAVVFAQLGQHTLLIDADMRTPSQDMLFGVENRLGFSAILSGRGGTELVQRIPGLENLWVLPAGAQPPNPLELLSRPRFPQLLRELNEFDVILFDTPAAAHYADAHRIAATVGAAVIVARNNKARISRVRTMSDAFTESGATLVGTVLNDF